MKLIIPHIDFSSADKRRKVHLPTVLDEKLAELIGIIIGDGHIGIYDSRKHNISLHKYKHYEIHIVSNPEDDETYVHHIKKLFLECFNIEMNSKTHKKQKLTTLRIDSKAIVCYLNSLFGIPINNKSKIIKIPDIIKQSSKAEKASFLRGIADTDFSFTFKKKYRKVHYYPVIKGKFLSKALVEDLYLLLKELNLNPRLGFNELSYDKRTGRTDVEHAVYLSGRENFVKWVNEIGFSNKKNLVKATIWKKFGFYPPNLTYLDREKIMTGELTPASFYGLEEIRTLDHQLRGLLLYPD
jgi:hypothetical protein